MAVALQCQGFCQEFSMRCMYVRNHRAPNGKACAGYALCPSCVAWLGARGSPHGIGIAQILFCMRCCQRLGTRRKALVRPDPTLHHTVYWLQCDNLACLEWHEVSPELHAKFKDSRTMTCGMLGLCCASNHRLPGGNAPMPDALHPDDDPWRVLGVLRGASLLEVKRKFKYLAVRLHPDKGIAVDGVAFIRVRAAYEQIVSSLQPPRPPPRRPPARKGLRRCRQKRPVARVRLAGKQGQRMFYRMLPLRPAVRAREQDWAHILGRQLPCMLRSPISINCTWLTGAVDASGLSPSQRSQIQRHMEGNSVLRRHVSRAFQHAMEAHFFGRETRALPRLGCP